MKIKLDENMGRSAQRLLQRAGHDVERVTEENLSGCADADLWQFVRSEERFLVTLDRDFSDIRSYAPGTHPGVLVLRPREPSPRSITRILERVLAEWPLERLARTLAVADDLRTRVRSRPPAGEG